MKSKAVYPSYAGKSSEVLYAAKADKELREARWEVHRKRIGISHTKESATEDDRVIFEKIKVNQILFMKNNIRRKECVKFVPKRKAKTKTNDPVKCHCGALQDKHFMTAEEEFFRKESKQTEQEGNATEKWSKDLDIMEFETNAFGKIDFQYEDVGGRKPAKYIRLSDQTPVDLVIELLFDHWHMAYPRPANLVITVIGGAKNFRLDGRKKEIFSRGLINAAQTTNAWIITSGCNMGVTRAVGEAVSEAQSYTYDKNGMTHILRSIGIAPWGYVLDNSTLINEQSTGSWNASYKPRNVIEHGSPVSLNPHDTHFLLVDDGFRGQYGGVADFRARLESRLAAPTDPKPGQEKGRGIPVVLVVVEGGYDAIVDVSRSIKARIPCVICEGTGRAADILAYACLHFVTTSDHKRVMKDQYRRIVEDKLISAYGKTWADHGDVKTQAKRFLNIVMDCCQDDKLITVFDMNKNEELDVAILSALLKGKGAKDLAQLQDQLRLAMTWNRTDIARDDIFTLNVTWPRGTLNEIMTDALIDNKTGFVRLLLKNGLIMNEYLTAPRLRMLYNKVPKTHRLRILLEKKTSRRVFTLNDIDTLLQVLLDKYSCQTYKQDTDIIAVTKNIEVSLGRGKDKLEKPYKDLFLWAVLMSRQELAKFFWEHGSEAIPSALAASKIYDSMAKQVAHDDSDLNTSFLKNKDEFECLAMKVLEECNKLYPEKAAMLIERKYPGWGNMNCLEMAAHSSDMEFLSTVCCQNSLTLMWKRGICSHSALIPFCLIFPPLLFLIIKFQAFGRKEETLTPQQKIITFFRAPVTKFSAHLINYMIFLILYSYMLLFGFKPKVTTIEWIVIGWLLTICVEELREMFFNPLADTFKHRLRLWWTFSAFNRINALIIILTVLALILRFVDGVPPIYAKNVYSIMAVFLFIRVLREYSASSSLGPKLVMINQMLKELILFMLILLVFLLACGISTQALMFPYRDFSLTIFRDLVYYPYWQAFGELNMDVIEGRTDDCRNSTTDADGRSCPRFSILVIILTASYLLVTNLLLLNILIAIFNHVFTAIQANSIQIWKYGIYFLVVEYDNKPTLAAPFIIFEHMFMILKWICRRTCCQPKPVDNSYELMYEMTLKIFEKECVKESLRREEISEQEVLPKKLAFIYNRVDEIAKLMEEEHLIKQQHLEAEQNKTQEQTAGGYDFKFEGRRLETQDSVISEGSADLSSLSEAECSRPETESQQRAFRRWPTVSALEELRVKLEKIEEINRENESTQEETVLPRAIVRTSRENVEATPRDQRREVVDVGQRRGALWRGSQNLETKLDKMDERLSTLESSIQDISSMLRLAIGLRGAHTSARGADPPGAVAPPASSASSEDDARWVGESAVGPMTSTPPSTGEARPASAPEGSRPDFFSPLRVKATTTTPPSWKRSGPPPPALVFNPDGPQTYPPANPFIFDEQDC